jgi:hypothetical protein
MVRSLAKAVVVMLLSLLVGVLVGAGVSGCTTKYVRIGRPALPPVASIEAEDQVLELYETGAIEPGDPLEAYLFQVENYMDYVHDLRGDPQPED